MRRRQQRTTAARSMPQQAAVTNTAGPRRLNAPRHPAGPFPKPSHPRNSNLSAQHDALTRTAASFTLSSCFGSFAWVSALLGAAPAVRILHSQMDRKRILLYALAFAVFAVLVYMQFRTWRHFDWTTFWSESGTWASLRTSTISSTAVALIYLAYAMRALRWKIFLRPVRPEASTLGAGSLRP